MSAINPSSSSIIIKDTHDSASNQKLYTKFDPNPDFMNALANQNIHHVFFEGASFDKDFGNVHSYNLEYRDDRAKALKILTGLLALNLYKNDQETYPFIKESVVADLKDHYNLVIPSNLNPQQEIEWIHNQLKVAVPEDISRQFEEDWKEPEQALGKYFQQRDEIIQKAIKEEMTKHPGERFVVVVGGMHEDAVRKIQSVTFKTLDAQKIYEATQPENFYSKLLEAQ